MCCAQTLGSDMAALHGGLRLDDGCLLIGSVTPRRAGDYVVVFPVDTKGLPESSTVELPRGRALAVGTDLEVGVGSYGVERAGDSVSDPAALSHIESCYLRHRADALWIG